MSGPCNGLTVLDFSLGMPGAICTLVMADYGAEVIKVEPPGGDPFRFQPAWFSWNRGKKSIVLDLSTADGREQAIQLAGEVDVLEALADARSRYRVDGRRISVRGFSMGGAACWQFAVHYADRWFAANPGAGFSETPEFLRFFQKEP